MVTTGVSLVLSGRLSGSSLGGEVVVVTGGGGGIGLEAARSLLSLGAVVVVAEVDPIQCSTAVAELHSVCAPDRVMGLPVDVSDVKSVREMVQAVLSRFGKIDVVLNNATYAPAGAAVVETPVDAWDRSYAVNLRGPALLARECIPAMIERRHGVFVCVSSTGGPFLAAYETLKAAQVALASSLDAELAGTGVTAFTIGPGLVPTATARAAISRITPRMGTTVEEFWRANQGAVVSVEAAGTGFAAAIAMADRYAGQEISSTQALVDAGIALRDEPVAPPRASMSAAEFESAAGACRLALRTLQQQAAEWKQRSFFERQWMSRDFKQRVGMPIERCLEMLSALEGSLASGGPAAVERDWDGLKRLARYYVHLGELAAGYVKDGQERERQVALTSGWAAEVEALVASLGR